MANKKKKDPIMLPSSEIEQLQQQYVEELETNPAYSLMVDPKDKYNLSDQQKTFILNFVQYKSIPTAADLTDIDMDTAREFFRKFEVQQEIKRLNTALYYRQFSSKLLDLDAIGGYLSSLIMEQNVPVADRLAPKEKLKAAELLIKLNEMKNQSFSDPSIIMNKDISAEIRGLSVRAIKRLLNESNVEDKSKLIEEIGGSDGLSIEESGYLQSLSTKELLEIIEQNKKTGGNDE